MKLDDLDVNTDLGARVHYALNHAPMDVDAIHALIDLVHSLGNKVLDDPNLDHLGADHPDCVWRRLQAREDDLQTMLDRIYGANVYNEEQYERNAIELYTFYGIRI